MRYNINPQITKKLGLKMHPNISNNPIKDPIIKEMMFKSVRDWTSEEKMHLASEYMSLNLKFDRLLKVLNDFRSQ